MNGDLVAVHLYGPLAEKFGHRHEFDISTPIEAVRALDANYPGFLDTFKEADVYYIQADGDWRGDAEITFPVGRELHFVPHIEGRYFLGPMIVGAISTGLGLGLSVGTVNILGGLLATGVLIGVSFLLKPKAPKVAKDKPKTESYAFSGPENVTEQGVPVPLVYGRVHCGSVVISAGLEVNDEPATASGGVNLPGGSAQNPSTAPAYPGGFPKLVGSGNNRHPDGWVIHTTDDDENAKIWRPNPQPKAGWFYWWWRIEKGYSPNGFFVTRGIT